MVKKIIWKWYEGNEHVARVHHACDICEKLSDAMKNGRCIYYYIDLGSITMNHIYIESTSESES